MLSTEVEERAMRVRVASLDNLTSLEGSWEDATPSHSMGNEELGAREYREVYEEGYISPSREQTIPHRELGLRVASTGNLQNLLLSSLPRHVTDLFATLIHPLAYDPLSLILMAG